MLPRTQQFVILLLGLSLAGLLAWRAGWPGGAAPALPPPPPYYFVAIQGAVPQPGVRFFAAPPTVGLVWQAAGGRGEVSRSREPLRSGSQITVSPAGQVTIEAMAGADLITLGLALDLNRADAVDLEAVPGLGPVLAHRITAFREEHGPFRDLEALLQVKGIGPKMLEKIRPYVVIITESGPPAAAPPREADRDGQD